jgi:methyl-accepting chemotaxis protein
MKNKIVKAFLTIVSVLVISEIYLLVSHYIITSKYLQTTDSLISEYQLVDNSSKLVNSFYDLIQYSNDQERIRTFKSRIDDLQVLLNKLDASLAGSDSWTIYLGVKNTVNVVISDVNKGLEDMSAGNFSGITASYFKAASDNNFVRDNASNLLLKELESVKATQDKVAKTDFWSEIIGLLLFIAVIIGSLLHSFSFSKKLTDPLLKLTQFAKKISSGDFEEKMDADLKTESTEVATIAESLESIAGTLKDGVKKIKAKDEQLAQTIKNLTGHEALDDKDDDGDPTGS